MTLVDSHCHLDDERFDADREQAIARALDAGVTTMLAIGTGDGPPDLEVAVRLADCHNSIYASVGVHPHDAAKSTAETLLRLAGLLKHPKVVALGEIGLDYHYDFSPRDQQRAVFAEQLRIASDAAVPIIIHTREAWDDTLDLIQRHWRADAGGIMHCFTGDAAQARQALDLGFSLSFGGVLTFPKAAAVREAAAMTPAGKLLIETDAPYLAPVPHRGKRNEPAFVIETASKLAELRGIALEEVARLTTDNFRRLCLQRVKTEEYTG